VKEDLAISLPGGEESTMRQRLAAIVLGIMMTAQLSQAQSLLAPEPKKEFKAERAVAALAALVKQPKVEPQQLSAGEWSQATVSRRRSGIRGPIARVSYWPDYLKHIANRLVSVHAAAAN
jgi:hypothetical protein